MTILDKVELGRLDRSPKGVTMREVVMGPCPHCGSPNVLRRETECVPENSKRTPAKYVTFACANCGFAR